MGACFGTAPEVFTTIIADDGILHFIDFRIRCLCVKASLKFCARGGNIVGTTFG